MKILENIYNILILVPKVILAVFPLYNTLSDFQQNLIAAALGVPPIIIGLLLLVKKLKYFWR